MRNISRRIDTIEKRLSVGQHEKPRAPDMIICVLLGRSMTDEDRARLGPTETWITYQEQLQAGKNANAEYLKNNPFGLPKVITIKLDAHKEYQAREQLKATENNQLSENSGVV